MNLFKTTYLALSLAILSSCNYEREVKYEEYQNLPGTLFRKNDQMESTFLYDYSGDKKIDLVRYGPMRGVTNIIAIDSSLVTDERFKKYIHKHTVFLTDEMKDLATKITEMQRELNFKIDSTIYANNR
jgi:hypothetical protein